MTKSKDSGFLRQQLDLEMLERILQIESIEGIPYDKLLGFFREELKGKNLPLDFHRVDPRNGDRILYSGARSFRPHDNSVVERIDRGDERACVICQGETTGVVDVMSLSEGFTFINKNLFPVVFPFEGVESGATPASSVEDMASTGLHFLQWTSSLHEKDWHNMSKQDRMIVMTRLAALEKVLLQGGLSRDQDQLDRYVSVIKNFGSAVGASLEHGHQQIVLGNVKPRTVQDHEDFQHEIGEPFSSYLQRETRTDLVVKDYGVAAMIIPYFMRRPYMVMLVFKEASKGFLHELSKEELEAAAEGWFDATRAFHALMPQMGKDIAYNIIMHNGAGAGLYFEFLPYTQTMGGLEHLGLYVCQETPRRAADWLRRFLDT
jgi:galactose-1-phosphate uridylyltransferase